MSVVTERKLLPSELRLVEQKLYDYRINKSLTKEYLAQREELARNIKQRKPRDPMTVQLLLLEEKARREQFWLEAIEGERARKRQVASLKKGEERPVKDNCPEREGGQTRDKVAQSEVI